MAARVHLIFRQLNDLAKAHASRGTSVEDPRVQELVAMVRLPVSEPSPSASGTEMESQGPGTEMESQGPGDTPERFTQGPRAPGKSAASQSTSDCEEVAEDIPRNSHGLPDFDALGDAEGPANEEDVQAAPQQNGSSSSKGSKEFPAPTLAVSLLSSDEEGLEEVETKKKLPRRKGGMKNLALLNKALKGPNGRPKVGDQKPGDKDSQKPAGSEPDHAQAAQGNGKAEGGGGAGGTVRKRPAASEAQAEPSQAEPKARAWQRVGEDEVIVPPISLHNAKLPQVRTYICGISEARGCKVHVCAAPASRFKNYREIAEKVAAKMAEQRMTKAQAKEYLNSLDTA